MLFCLILMFFLFTLAVFFLLPVFLSKKLGSIVSANFFDGAPAKIFLRCAVSRLKKTHQCRSDVSQSDRDSRVLMRCEGSRSDPECEMLRLCYGVWKSVCDCLITCIIVELERTAKPAAGAAGGRPPQEPLQNKCCFLGKTTVVLLFWQQKQQFFVVLATKTTVFCCFGNKNNKNFFDKKKFEKNFLKKKLFLKKTFEFFFVTFFCDNFGS